MNKLARRVGGWSSIVVVMGVAGCGMTGGAPDSSQPVPDLTMNVTHDLTMTTPPDQTVLLSPDLSTGPDDLESSPDLTAQPDFAMPDLATPDLACVGIGCSCSDDAICVAGGATAICVGG